MTAIAQPREPINLHKFYPLVNSFYKFELFSGLRITKYEKVCVNLFSSGKLVLCGIQSEEQANVITQDIYSIYHNTYISKNCVCN